MERFQDAPVLIMDDDLAICGVLGGLTKRWGLKPRIVYDCRLPLDQMEEACFDVALLDIYMSGVTGFDLIPEILDLCPDTKIIMISGYADKENAITALKMGAFDFLEKPVSAGLLYHALLRALEAREKERKLKTVLEELRNSKAELLTQKQQLEFFNDQLTDTNRALSILAQNVDRERDQLEKRIAGKLRSLVLPTIDKLRTRKDLSPYRGELDMLVFQIEDLTSGFTPNSVIASTLSSTELRIASLIKNNISTEEIARQLHISPATVRTHRKNIRKKLKINDAKYSLRNYLQSAPSSAQAAN
jgi:FixJ family two-component response regulator